MSSDIHTSSFNTEIFMPIRGSASWNVLTEKLYTLHWVMKDSRPSSSSGLSAPKARRMRAFESMQRRAAAVRLKTSPISANLPLPRCGVPRKTTADVDLTMSWNSSSAELWERRKTCVS
jgi:hypothetical protein